MGVLFWSCFPFKLLELFPFQTDELMKTFSIVENFIDIGHLVLILLFNIIFSSICSDLVPNIILILIIICDKGFTIILQRGVSAFKNEI